MGAFLKFLFTIPFIVILFWLSFANRAEITLVWSPVHEAVTINVAVLLLIAVAAGFIWGALMTWLNYAPLRRAARHNKKAVTRLEKELTVVKTQTQTPAVAIAPPASSPVLLP